MTSYHDQNLDRHKKAAELLAAYQNEGFGGPEAALRAVADLRRIYTDMNEHDAFEMVWSAMRR